MEFVTSSLGVYKWSCGCRTSIRWAGLSGAEWRKCWWPGLSAVCSVCGAGASSPPFVLLLTHCDRLLILNTMNWAVLLVCLVGWTSCQAATMVEPQEKEKGLIEWISNLLGNNPTPTTVKPVYQDPPTSCPACQCGVARTKRRIVGGYETKEREYPWMAMLMYNGRFFCGGSLINDLYVLTAAHCTGYRKERITIRLLEHDTSNPNETKTIDRKVAAVIRHQRYNPGTYDNDIALMRLDERLDLSTAVKRIRRDEDGTTPATEETTTTPDPADDVRVRPVCLPTPGLSFTRECAVVIGWGVTDEGGSVSNTLQEVKVPIVSNAECKDRSYGRRITDNMMCAGEPDGGRDACQGDSGGPLHVFNQTTEKYQEVGVVSWGEGCARPDKYGVYSRVNRYLTWIKSNTVDACYCN
ncbi:trypsin-like isoform X1 [Spodoptera litura]|uniref:Trypsin-like isoform X1 n=2 Tax=Spodoptera litura TaxID=69820 RepID=A0A9J7EEC5_SPOLT|nr:trypsin-like isoform X1 [Spodoptera litura]